MVIDVLLVLATNQGSVVSKDELVDNVWGGRATADDAIAAKISALRKALGDNRKDPAFVETVSKRGYRLKESVSNRVSRETELTPPARRHVALFAGIIGLAVAILAAYVYWPRDEQISSVAVLQFRNLSEDTEKFQYVAEGFSEELVVSLDQVPNLRFTRGAESLYGESTRQIARQLDVDAVITGSLRTDGNRMRVTVEVISANGYQLWANKFDGASKDIFSIQERVATEARNAIIGETSGDFQAVSRPANWEAFDTYMRGLFFLSKRDPVSLHRARTLFDETVNLDPYFGPAYLRQAMTLLILARFQSGGEAELYDQALATAQLGATLDPGIREPLQIIYGWVNHQRGKWEDAADAYARAIKADTVYPTAHHWYSLLLGDLGFEEQALDQALTALALEPASPSLNSRVAITYFWNGDIENARRFFQYANSMGIGVPDHYLAYSLFSLRENRPDEAHKSARTAVEVAQRPSQWIDPIFDSLANPDDRLLAEAAYRTIDSIASDESAPVYIAMTLNAVFGRTARMMDIALQRARDVGTIKNLELVYQDEFAAFRQEPEFSALLDELGLTRYWSSAGCRWSDDQLVCDATK
jgi:TolB-like protein/tetratricopeptide (TPR) repeat protein